MALRSPQRPTAVPTTREAGVQSGAQTSRSHGSYRSIGAPMIRPSSHWRRRPVSRRMRRQSSSRLRRSASVSARREANRSANSAGVWVATCWRQLMPGMATRSTRSRRALSHQQAMAQIIRNAEHGSGHAVRSEGGAQATRCTVSEGYMEGTLHRSVCLRSGRLWGVSNKQLRRLMVPLDARLQDAMFEERHVALGQGVVPAWGRSAVRAVKWGCSGSG